MRLNKLGIDIEVVARFFNVEINGTPWLELPGLEKEVPERKLLHEVTFRDCALTKRVM